MRDNPRYAALWRGDARLAELIASRRKARAAGQMTGPYRPGRNWVG